MIKQSIADQVQEVFYSHYSHVSSTCLLFLLPLLFSFSSNSVDDESGRDCGRAQTQSQDPRLQSTETTEEWILLFSLRWFRRRETFSEDEQEQQPLQW